MNLTLSVPLNLNEKYVIAVSGGVDSMVLLDYLYQLNHQLIVVHFNHLARKEAILDKELLEKYTTLRKIPFYYFELNISKSDFQNQARLLRKKHLEQVAFENQCQNILTAHHLDDLAETILMKLNRGSSLLGYSGMQPFYTKHGYHYIKPLLYIDKETLLAYAKENDLPFLEDGSNFKDDYLRNRMRHHVIPALKKENDFLKHIITFHTQMLDAHHLIRKESLLFLTTYHHQIDLMAYKKLDKAIQTDVLLYLFELNDILPNFELISSIHQALVQNQKPNLFFDLKNDFVLIKNYQVAFIEKRKYLHENLVLPQVIVSDNLKVFKEDYVEICYNKLDYPLSVRHRKDGDILNFPFGRKKLKDFLIDKKVPLQKRDDLWLVVDSNDQIIWIPNLYLNQVLGTKNKIYLSLWEDPHAQ